MRPESCKTIPFCPLSSAPVRALDLILEPLKCLGKCHCGNPHCHNASGFATQFVRTHRESVSCRDSIFPTPLCRHTGLEQRRKAKGFRFVHYAISNLNLGTHTWYDVVQHYYSGTGYCTNVPDKTLYLCTPAACTCAYTCICAVPR